MIPRRLILVFAGCFLLMRETSMATMQGGPLVISLSIPEGQKLDPSNIPLIVHFRNNGKEKLRLVDIFDLDVQQGLFTFTVSGKNGPLPRQGASGHFVGTPLDTKGPYLKGFELLDEWGAGPHVKYLELESGRETTKIVHLEKAVIGTLEPGDYSTNVTYTNIMGKDCFKGQVASAVIQITLKAK
jgi:hypothetical protein